MKATTPQKAVIYCRVSSKKQVREGDGSIGWIRALLQLREAVEQAGVPVDLALLHELPCDDAEQ